ncbi:MAG TPA: hypothetical protein VM166_07550 [Gemmatimonadaceae bacterium]|nr:hypothetical protein [Gemmatimonadaceae bacterium]
MIGTALVTGVPLLRDAWSNYRNWSATSNDPSAKDAYLTFLQVDIGLLVILIVIGVAGSLILRPAHRTKKAIDGG